MKDLFCMSLRSEGNKLYILDQQKLPFEEVWFEVKDISDMIFAIKELKVRGAPLIGVAAALALAHSAQRDTSQEKLLAEAQALREARPTAVNLAHAVDRVVAKLSDRDSFMKLSEQIFEEDVLLCESMGNFGATLIEDGDSILTHCNTGGLATVGIGTALGAIRKAYEQKKKIHVYVDETRPLLQGGRLTTWELEKLGIPHTLICDNMAAVLMSKGKIQKVFVGADRIARNGDFANKIGTYSVAVLAHHHKIPFYPVAPITTVDVHCKSGQEIVIEQRESGEVKGFGNVQWAPKRASVFNPSFDVTPVEFVNSLVLDRGVFTRSDLKNDILVELST